MEPSKAIQERCHQELKQMLQMWHNVDMIDFQLKEWNKTLWDDINCEDMDDRAKVPPLSRSLSLSPSLSLFHSLTLSLSRSLALSLPQTPNPKP